MNLTTFKLKLYNMSSKKYRNGAIAAISFVLSIAFTMVAVAIPRIFLLSGGFSAILLFVIGPFFWGRSW